MKGTLSANEKAALARLYESDGYQALKKLIEQERINIATKCLEAPDFEQVKFLHGQEYALKQLHLHIRSIFKEEQKK